MSPSAMRNSLNFSNTAVSCAITPCCSASHKSGSLWRMPGSSAAMSAGSGGREQQSHSRGQSRVRKSRENCGEADKKRSSELVSLNCSSVPVHARKLSGALTGKLFGDFGGSTERVFLTAENMGKQLHGFGDDVLQS